MTLSALIEQPIVSRWLASVIQEDHRRHVIVEGGYGLGKTTAARIYALTLNYEAVIAAERPSPGEFGKR